MDSFIPRVAFAIVVVVVVAVVVVVVVRMYVFTQSLLHKQDATQGQFLAKYSQLEYRVFLLQDLFLLSRQQNSIYDAIYLHIGGKKMESCLFKGH